MPTYSGAGRTTTYLRKRDLQHAAQNNSKITLFFPPKPKQITKTTHDGAAMAPQAPEVSQSPPELHSNSETQAASTKPCSIDPVLAAQPIPLIADVDTTEEPAATFLDTTEDDSDAIKPISVLESIKKLIIDAKKYKSFTLLFYLTSLKQFVELWEKYKQNPRIKAPMVKASHVVAASVGKGPYVARKICTLYRYVACFHTLPPTNTSKHHAHPSLLNNKRIAQAVCQYLTVLSDGKVS